MIDGTIHAVRTALERGDEQAALKTLEAEREYAKSRRDIDALAALLPLARAGHGNTSGRRRAAWERTVYAIEQNMAFLGRRPPGHQQLTPSAPRDVQPASTTGAEPSTEEILADYLKSLAPSDRPPVAEIDLVVDDPLPQAGAGPSMTSDYTLPTEVKRSGEPIDSGSTDPIDLIRRLAELQAAGVLTDEEFSQKKAEILSRI